MTKLIIGWNRPEWHHEDAKFLQRLEPYCAMFKFGSELRDRRSTYMGGAFSLFDAFMRDCERLEIDVMLDFKEAQTADTARAAFGQFPWGVIRMVTIDGHVSGSCMADMAFCCREHGAQLAAIAIKTDVDDADCREMYGCTSKNAALRLTERAKRWGAGGVVIPARFVRAARDEGLCDGYFFSIVAGVRNPGEHSNNHRRPTTPRQLARIQPTYAVVQSSIWQSKDPIAAAQKICAQIAG